MDEFRDPPGSTLPDKEAPPGYVLPHGQTIRREDYPDLFAAIDALLSLGDESTTFDLPDFREQLITKDS